MQKGSIRVQTENIFPIIKKFLYSDHEIFIRELVSNAVDATQKLKTFSSLGEVKGDIDNIVYICIGSFIMKCERIFSNDDIFYRYRSGLFTNQFFLQKASYRIPVIADCFTPAIYN